MNRRQFIHFLGAGLATIAVASSPGGSSFLSGIWSTVKRRLSGCRCNGNVPLCNHCKEAIIAQALSTPEGRVALAQAMVEPIRRQLDYQAIGRKLLMVDELPKGSFEKLAKLN